MSKITEADRAKLIDDLKALYKQSLDFISSVKNGTSKNKYSKETMEEFNKVKEQLGDYIKDLEKGLELEIPLSDWCEMLGDVLLDDDNFYIEEDGYSWH